MARLTLLLVVTLLAGCALQPSAYDATARIPEPALRDADRQLVLTIRDEQSGLRTAPGATPRALGSSSTYQGSAYAQRVVRELERGYSMTWVAGWRIDLLDVHCVVFQARDVAERDALIERLKRDRRVESVQPMHMFHTSAYPTGPPQGYNDPYFRLQMGVAAIQAPAVHRWSLGRGVTVAVIDTGVDLTHPDLAGRVRVARNFVDDNRVVFGSDRHGTAMAGVIAAVGNNGIGIVGVAPAVELLALKACWHEQPQAVALCNTLSLAQALAFAITQRARIINLSLTGPKDPLLDRLVAKAVQSGIAVVAPYDDRLSPEARFPISTSGVIAVADADRPADQPSARQVSTAPRPTPLAAPGQEVLTLTPGGHYDYVSGASISSAIVSGVVALLLQLNHSLSPAQAEALLDRTALPHATSASRLVNACDAVATLMRAGGCTGIAKE